MKPNHLYWLTERTPHECLPLTRRTFRQFFRVVSSDVSIWFECSSTKNPLGITPPSTTHVHRKDKFSIVNPKFSAAEEVSRMLSQYARFQPAKNESEISEKKSAAEDKFQ